jgi:hypothetical protein
MQVRRRLHQRTGTVLVWVLRLLYRVHHYAVQQEIEILFQQPVVMPQEVSKVNYVNYLMLLVKHYMLYFPPYVSLHTL